MPVAVAVAEQKEQEKKEKETAHLKKKAWPEFSYNPLPKFSPCRKGGHSSLAMCT